MEIVQKEGLTVKYFFVLCKLYPTLRDSYYTEKSYTEKQFFFNFPKYLTTGASPPFPFY